MEGAFYERDVTVVARELLGCELVVDGAGGTIVETEAYHESEPACHAYRGPTPRAQVLFGPPGRAYVYLSYGIHSLFNVVTGKPGEGAAVLVRALEPTRGVELMRNRRGRERVEELCAGPGMLAQALAIGLADNASALGGRITVLPRRADPGCVSGPRIGISRAAELPWRFSVPGSRFVSRPRP